MFSAFERMLAARYLGARRQEGFISVIAGFSFVGIALGVATLIIVMSVMNGFRTELLGRILGINGHMVVRSASGEGIAGHGEMAARIAALEGILRVAPIVEGQVLATGRGRSAGALVRGARAADLKAHSALAASLKAGDLDAFGPGNGVLVGARLARRLGLAVGTRITLLSPRGVATAFGTIPRTGSYPIAGTFDIGMYEYDSSLVFMPLEDAQLYFNLGDRVSGLEILVADPDRVAGWRAGVAEAAGPGIHIIDWQQSNSSFFNALQVERNVMFLILSLIIVIAAFNIIASMVMLVTDKSRGIAILRTMGATRGAIMRVFIMIGASIGVVGTLLGLALGTAFCLNIEAIRRFLEQFTGTDLFAAEIYFLSTMPAEMDPLEVTLSAALALVLALLATLYPAWRAARLDPVEVLRYE